MKTNLLPLMVVCVFALAVPLRAQSVGTLDVSYDPNVTYGSVHALATQPDGRMIIGGLFPKVGGATHANLARLNVDGSVDATFNATSNGYVYSVAVQADGKILLGGNFTFINGQPRNFIARLNADGSLESTATFNPGTNANRTVFSVAVQPDRKIVIGGAFFVFNGTGNNYIARLNANGSLESTATFNPGSGANDSVYSVALQANGKILLGGRFTEINNSRRSYIARLNADGSLESTATFNPGSGADNEVRTVAVKADGKILLGGQFNQINGTTRNKIALLNVNGSLESTVTFNPGIGPNNVIYSVGVQADGKIVLGGEFTEWNGMVRNRIARLNADGTLEGTTTFNPGTGSDLGIYGVGVQADGKIVLGGYFNQINGTLRNDIARLNNDAAIQSLSAPDATRVQWLRGGAGPEVSQVTFDLSTNGGSIWTLLGTGTRIAGGWELTGLDLPAGGSLRARGRVANGYNNGSSGLIEQVTTFPLPFPQWKLAQLGDANAPDLGDTDFDGLVHLAEYALNLSPTAPSLPPPAERHLYAEGERLRMFFTRDPARNDVTLEVQAADSPAGPWTTVAASTLGGVTTGPGYVGGDDATPGLKTVEVRDTVDISPTTASRYLRVKVTH